jgi:hypothetical protein
MYAEQLLYPARVGALLSYNVIRGNARLRHLTPPGYTPSCAVPSRSLLISHRRQHLSMVTWTGAARLRDRFQAGH